MSMKKIYSCNICGDAIEDPCGSFGVNFTDLKNFTLGGYGCTDGMHICYGCAKQLYKHLNAEPIKKELGV